MHTNQSSISSLTQELKSSEWEIEDGGNSIVSIRGKLSGL